MSQQINRKAGPGWLALSVLALLLLASIGTSSSYAQVADSPGRSTGTLEGEDGTEIGDPDIPSGETPVPSGAGGTPSYDGGGMSRGHAQSGGIEAVPQKRGGLWAHWRIALKMLARNLHYLR